MGSNFHEVVTVRAREVGDREDRALAPQDIVRERGDVAHVDPGTDHPTALANLLESLRYERADRGKDHRGIELFRRSLARPARPRAADRTGERLAFGIAI